MSSRAVLGLLCQRVYSDSQSVFKMLAPASSYDSSPGSAAEEMKVQNLRLDSLVLARLPEEFIVVKTSTFAIKNHVGLTRSCKLRVYGPTQLAGPLDETSIIELLFPENNLCCNRTIDYHDRAGWLFAERTIWHSPSMGVFAPYQVYPVKWLSRVTLRNPRHPHDYLVDIILDSLE